MSCLHVMMTYVHVGNCISSFMFFYEELNGCCFFFFFFKKRSLIHLPLDSWEKIKRPFTSQFVVKRLLNSRAMHRETASLLWSDDWSMMPYISAHWLLSFLPFTFCKKKPSLNWEICGNKSWGKIAFLQSFLINFNLVMRCLCHGKSWIYEIQMSNVLKN